METASECTPEPLGLSPTLASSFLCLASTGREKRAIDQGDRWLLLHPLPPALHCFFYLISQPCCHGTEDGNSTLVLNDLLDDSLLVRHSRPVLLKCTTERNELLVLLLLEGRGGFLTILL